MLNMAEPLPPPNEPPPGALRATPGPWPFTSPPPLPPVGQAVQFPIHIQDLQYPGTTATQRMPLPTPLRDAAATADEKDGDRSRSPRNVPIPVHDESYMDLTAELSEIINASHIRIQREIGEAQEQQMAEMFTEKELQLKAKYSAEVQAEMNAMKVQRQLHEQEMEMSAAQWQQVVTVHAASELEQYTEQLKGTLAMAETVAQEENMNHEQVIGQLGALFSAECNDQLAKQKVEHHAHIEAVIRSCNAEYTTEISKVQAQSEGKTLVQTELATQSVQHALARMKEEIRENVEWASYYHEQELEYAAQVHYIEWNASCQEIQQKDECDVLKEEYKRAEQCTEEHQVQFAEMIHKDNENKQMYMDRNSTEMNELKNNLARSLQELNQAGGELQTMQNEVRLLRQQQATVPNFLPITLPHRSTPIMPVTSPMPLPQQQVPALTTKHAGLRLPITGVGCNLDALAARPASNPAILRGVTTTNTPFTGWQPGRETPTTAQQPQQQQEAFLSALSTQQPAEIGAIRLDLTDGNSTEESEDEAFIRRRTQAKSFTLEPCGDATQLRQWISKLQAKAMSSSNRNKRRTQKYVRRIIHSTSIAALETVSKKWDSFDTEVSTAVFGCASSSLRHELILYRERCEREQRPCTGQAQLFLFLQRWDIERGQALQIDMQTLMGHKFNGSLEAYLNGLDEKLMNFIKEPDPDLLLSLVEPELRKAKADLAPEFVTYDRSNFASSEHSLKFLVDSARGAIARNRKLQAFQQLQPKSTKSPSMPAQGKGKDDKGKGGSKGKDDKGKGKSDKKGNGKKEKNNNTGAPPPPKPGEARKYNGKFLPCIRYALQGRCSFDNKCNMPHVKDGDHVPTDMYPQGLDMTTVCKINEIPCSFHAQGKCGKGDQCLMSHTAKPMPKMQPKPKGKAKAKCMIMAKPGSKSTGDWILDTGTSDDVCGDDGKVGTRVPSHNPKEFVTGGGIVEANDDIEVFLNELNEQVNAKALDKAAPKALTVGRRCAELGYEFHWKPYAQVPICRLPNRKRLDVHCENYVPYISTMQSKVENGYVMPMVEATPEDASLEYSIEEDNAEDDWARFREIDNNEDECWPAITEESEYLQADPEMIDALDAAIRAEDNEEIDESKVKYISIPAEEESEQILPTRKGNHLSVHHLTLHSPADPHHCSACRLGKATKTYARKRQLQGVTFDGGWDEPQFGVMLHLDHWKLKHGSLAAQAAPAALKLLDERSRFRGTIPTHDTDHATIIEQVRGFETVENPSRRWWTDSAPEFKKAARELRKSRPLDHFFTPPHRATANGVIERSNRTTVEGTNACIQNAGFDAKWWICAAPFWDMMHNAHSVQSDGHTAWWKRFNEHAPFQCYPWGSLVFVLPPKALEKDKRKFESKLRPHLLVTIGIGPGWSWNKTWGVIPLHRFFSEKRTSRACIRYSMDVVFPDQPSFPLKLKLNAAGAIGDTSLPAPMTTDPGQPFAVCDADDDESDIEALDGHLSENAPNLISTYFESVALDPEIPQENTDEADVANTSDAPPQPMPESETAVHGTRPPTAWRIDVFPSGRQVSVPPWSTRPPRVTPEDWIMMNKHIKAAETNAWKESDPQGFELQKKRNLAYKQDKAARSAVNAAALVRQLPQEPADVNTDAATPGECGTTTQPEASSPEVTESRSMTGRATSTGDISDLARLAKQKMLKGHFDQLLIEVCCEPDSILSENVRGRSLAIRVTKEDDLCMKNTGKALHSIIRTARHLGIKVHLWISIPCTAGCPWRYVNASKGRQTGDPEMTTKLVEVCKGLTKHVSTAGGEIYWEWPDTSALWAEHGITEFLTQKKYKCKSIDVSTAALGMRFNVDGEEVGVKKKWRLMMTNTKCHEAMQKYQDPPDNISYVHTAGSRTKETGRYTPELADVVWSSICPPASKDKLISNEAFDQCISNLLESGRDPFKDASPSMVVRSIPLKSDEAKTPESIAARDEEVAEHRKRGTWKEDSVTELSDLLKDPSKHEVMYGRVFGILGNKHDELEAEHHKKKYRSVFQGSNIRTKTGTSAIELFEEISSSPASFVAIRCALACAVLMKMVATVRDALCAYLQADIHVPGRIETWVSLPQSYWPNAWFEDGAKRLKPKYRNPYVLLIKALYGHPESGALWEKLLAGALKKRGWTSIPEWPGVWVHSDKSMLVVYVDDLLLCCLPANIKQHWSALDEAVEFKDPPEAIDKFIGATYKMTEFDPKNPSAPRTCSVDMCSYTKSMARKFVDGTKAVLNKSVTTPYINDKEEYGENDETTGRFASSCSSHAATSLFAARVARPDLAVSTQRLCSAVSRWKVIHDLALTRLMAYAAANGDLKMHCTLSPEDLKDLNIDSYSDADWNGDPETTRSTTGFHVELVGKKSGNVWAISWGSVLQTTTGSATAETETVSASHTLRREAIPIQILLEHFLGSRVPIVMLIDNTQCLSAIKKGYSKKLRHIGRTQRVCVGLLNELTVDKELKISAQHCPTDRHKGDMYTKCLALGSSRRH